MSINKVMISGNLTRDAELRTTAGGTAILSLGVAVNDRRRNAETGEWEDYANFVDCTMFGRRAEAIQRYLVKGTKVAIEGRLHYSSWEDRNSGQRRSKLDVTIDEIEFMSRADGSNYGGGQQGYGNQQAYNNQPARNAQPAYNPQPSYQQPAYQQPAPQRSQMQPIQEAPAPAAYTDEDIPF